MSNTFGSDILIQASDPRQAAAFYVETFGFSVTEDSPAMVSLRGPRLNLYIERGPALGPVLEVFVEDVDAAKAYLLEHGSALIKDEPEVPRCYVQDPFGLTYNLAR